MDAMYQFAHKYLMKGGRITMPAEYYGVDSGAYVANPTASSLAPTADAQVPALSQTGGACSCTRRKFEEAARRAKADLGIKRVEGGGIEAMYKAFLASGGSWGKAMPKAKPAAKPAAKAAPKPKKK